jgi:hypothetical protein
MVNILYVYHTLVLLFVFIYSIVSLVGQVKETFTGMLYIPNKPDNQELTSLFNIDNFSSRFVGWQKWWRQNQTHSTIPDEVYNTSMVSGSLPPLLYDGIKNINCQK